jgi:hypothetical protein
MDQFCAGGPREIEALSNSYGMSGGHPKDALWLPTWFRSEGDLEEDGASSGPRD